jgi:Transposase C of IS166 homeodomain
VSAEFQSSTLRPSTLEQAQALIAELQQKLQWAELKVSTLEERLRLQRIQKYGVGSEKLSNLQLQLLEEEPGVSQAEVQAESERPKLGEEAIEVVFPPRSSLL